MASDRPPDVYSSDSISDEDSGPVDTSRHYAEQRSAHVNVTIAAERGCDGERSWGPNDLLQRRGVVQGGPCGDSEECGAGQMLVQRCPENAGAAWGRSESFREADALEGEEACSSDEPQEDGWDDIGGDDGDWHYSNTRMLEVAASSEEGLGLVCADRGNVSDDELLDLRHQVCQHQAPPAEDAGGGKRLQHHCQEEQGPNQRRAAASCAGIGDTDSQEDCSGGKDVVVTEAKTWEWQELHASSGTGTKSEDALPKHAVDVRRCQVLESRNCGVWRVANVDSAPGKIGNDDFALQSRDANCVSWNAEDAEEMEMEALSRAACQRDPFCGEGVAVDITRIDAARQARLWQAITAGQDREPLVRAAKAKPKKQATLRAFFAQQQSLLH